MVRSTGFEGLKNENEVYKDYEILKKKFEKILREFLMLKREHESQKKIYGNNEKIFPKLSIEVKLIALTEKYESDIKILLRDLKIIDQKILKEEFSFDHKNQESEIYVGYNDLNYRVSPESVNKRFIKGTDVFTDIAFKDKDNFFIIQCGNGYAQFNNGIVFDAISYKSKMIVFL